MERNLGAAYQLYLNSANNSPLNKITTLQIRRKLAFQVCKQKEQFQVQQIIQFQGHQ